jgi:pyridoxine 4-dehydrogenase
LTTSIDLISKEEQASSGPILSFKIEAMAFTIAGKTITSPIGFGMGGLTAIGKLSFEEAIPVLKAALEHGANFWDAGENYGTMDRNSLHLLHAYFTKYPEDAEKVCISVKSSFDMANARTLCDAASIKESIERCLKVLDGKCHIDIWQPARLDANIPIEETVGAIAEYVKAGKIGSVGLSECSANSICKARAVAPVAAVEVEVSLFETGIFSNGVADACKEFGIPIIAYSPLNRGMLTGQYRKYEDVPDDDFKKKFKFPRWMPEVWDNMKLVHEVEAIAEKKSCTSLQVALAWVAAKSNVVGAPVVPIPGTTSISRLEKNMKLVKLTEEDLKELQEILDRIEVKGSRYPERFQHTLNI